MMNTLHLAAQFLWVGFLETVRLAARSFMFPAGLETRKEKGYLIFLYSLLIFCNCSAVFFRADECISIPLRQSR